MSVQVILWLQAFWHAGLNHDYKEAFRMGVACGSASAFSEYLAESEMIEKVYNQVQVNECK